MAEVFLFVPEVTEIGPRCLSCPGDICDIHLDTILMVQQANTLAIAKGEQPDTLVPLENRISTQNEFGCSLGEYNMTELFANVCGNETLINSANLVLGSQVTVKDI